MGPIVLLAGKSLVFGLACLIVGFGILRALEGPAKRLLGRPSSLDTEGRRILLPFLP